jgi:hypothetical protein
MQAAAAAAGRPRPAPTRCARRAPGRPPPTPPPPGPAPPPPAPPADPLTHPPPFPTPPHPRPQDARLYLDPVRECYEAYVIYNFYAYLTNFLEVGTVQCMGALLSAGGCGRACAPRAAMGACVIYSFYAYLTNLEVGLGQGGVGINIGRRCSGGRGPPRGGAPCSCTKPACGGAPAAAAATGDEAARARPEASS